MKILIPILLFISINSYAQRSGNARTIFTNIGIKTSLGSSFITNKDIKSDKNLSFNNFALYYSYGITASISYIGMKPRNAIFSIQGEFLRGNFSHQFTKIETDSKLNYTKNINYIIDNKIITVRYENTKQNIFIGIGYQSSLFVSVNEQNSINNPHFYSQKFNYNLVNFYHDYGSLVIDLGITKHNFLISLRITTPILDINKDNNSPIFDGVYNNFDINSSYYNKYTNAKTYQFTAQLSIAYRIPFISFGRATSGHDGFSIFKKLNRDYYWGK